MALYKFPIAFSVTSETLAGIYLEKAELNDGFYITHNGRLVPKSQYLHPDQTYYLLPRVFGGKGGFGSMLRAIGAQIEKTTNHEACRDLSGRRMRDVNNEQQLREWAKTKVEREREAEIKRQERAAKRKQALTDKRHQFDDQDYHRQKMQALENMEEALVQGLQKQSGSGSVARAPVASTSVACASSAASTSSTLDAAAAKSRKRKRKADPGPEAMKKACEWLGVDVASLADLSDSDGSTSGGSSSEHESDEDNTDCTPHDTAAVNEAEATAKTSTTELSDKTSPETTELSDKMSPETTGLSDKTSHEKSSGGSGLLATLASIPPKNVSKTSPKAANGDTVISTASKVSEQITSTTTSNPEEPVDLERFASANELAALGLDRLKHALMTRQLKCGGTLQQRADRLYSVKGKTRQQIDPKLFAKPQPPQKSQEKIKLQTT